MQPYLGASGHKETKEAKKATNFKSLFAAFHQDSENLQNDTQKIF